MVCHSHPLRGPGGRADPLPSSVMVACLRRFCRRSQGRGEASTLPLTFLSQKHTSARFLCDSSIETALSPRAQRASLEEERGDHMPGWIAEAPAALLPEDSKPLLCLTGPRSLRKEGLRVIRRTNSPTYSVAHSLVSGSLSFCSDPFPA